MWPNCCLGAGEADDDPLAADNRTPTLAGGAKAIGAHGLDGSPVEAGAACGFHDLRVVRTAVGEDHRSTLLAPGQHESLFEEYFVALDADDMVRGGYVLKHQDFFVNSKVLHVG